MKRQAQSFPTPGRMSLTHVFATRFVARTRTAGHILGKEGAILLATLVRHLPALDQDVLC